MAIEYMYISTYRTAKSNAQFISFIGWAIFLISLVIFVLSLVSTAGDLSKQSINPYILGGFVLSTTLPAFFGIVSGLLLIIIGQLTRATLDSADYNGEMLAMMKANLAAKNITEEE